MPIPTDRTTVKLTLSFPGALPRAVVEDRLFLAAWGKLTLMDIEAVLDSWDTSEVPHGRGN